MLGTDADGVCAGAQMFVRGPLCAIIEGYQGLGIATCAFSELPAEVGSGGTGEGLDTFQSDQEIRLLFNLQLVGQSFRFLHCGHLKFCSFILLCIRVI